VLKRKGASGAGREAGRGRATKEGRGRSSEPQGAATSGFHPPAAAAARNVGPEESTLGGPGEGKVAPPSGTQAEDTGGHGSRMSSLPAAVAAARGARGHGAGVSQTAAEAGPTGLVPVLTGGSAAWRRSQMLSEGLCRGSRARHPGAAGRQGPAGGSCRYNDQEKDKEPENGTEGLADASRSQAAAGGRAARF